MDIIVGKKYVSQGMSCTVDRVTEKTVYYSGELSGYCRRSTFERDFHVVGAEEIGTPVLETTAVGFDAEDQVDQIISSEPNFKRFRHRGLNCFIVRHPVMGHLCGYVQVPRGTKLERHLRKADRNKVSAYDSHRLRGIDVHWGLSFCGSSRHYRMKKGIWLGFDCAHLGDVIPKFKQLEGMLTGTSLKLNAGSAYRDICYVEGEVRGLADQITRVLSGGK